MNTKGTRGYTLIYVLIILSAVGLLMTQALHQSASSARANLSTKIRSERHHEVQQSISHTLSWLRQNSQKLVTPFRRTQFYTEFIRTNPSIGTNDHAQNGIPTKIKLAGTNNTAILTNDPALATAAFATTRDITTNSLFNAVSEFSSAQLGNASVRVTLVDAIAVTPAQDYGPPPALAPETDFYPVYRIDAMTEDDKGSYIYSSVQGRVIHVFDLGIYGQDYLEINQPCDSFRSALGSYSSATKRANCPAGSNSTAAVHKNEEIYGSLSTNGSIESDPPFGGYTCADFTAGCPNKGETCAGEDCGVPLLETYDAWNVYCPQQKAAVSYSGTLASTNTLNLVDSDPSTPVILPIDRCWGSVTVATNATIYLTATNSPYYIDTLTLQNNSNSRISIAPSPNTGTVELYVRTITGDSFNGNQMINTTGKPTQFRLYYLGTNDLTLNGSAAMNIALVAPNANVVVSGNFEYQGALLAQQLILNGSGGVHYDESLGGSGPVVDTQYRQKELIQYYR